MRISIPNFIKICPTVSVKQYVNGGARLLHYTFILYISYSYPTGTVGSRPGVKRPELGADH